MKDIASSPTVIAIGIFTVAYLALFFYLINYYLPRVQISTWEELGRPLFQHPLFREDHWSEDIRKWLSTARFLFWSNQYAALKDPQLTRLIWSIRTIFVGVLFLWASFFGFLIIYKPN